MKGGLGKTAQRQPLVYYALVANRGQSRVSNGRTGMRKNEASSSMTNSPSERTFLEHLGAPRGSRPAWVDMATAGALLLASGVAFFVFSIRVPVGPTVLTVSGLLLLLAGAYVKSRHPRFGIVERPNKNSGSGRDESR